MKFSSQVVEFPIVNRNRLLVIVLIVILFVIAGLFIRHLTKPAGFGDSKIYLAMAKSVWTFTESPWGYRIAVPYLAAYLAYYLRIPLETVFFALQMGMYALTLAGLFWWFRFGLRMRPYTTVLGLLLFVFSYPGVYNLHNTLHVGFAEHLLLVLGCIAIYQNYYLILVFLVAASSFVKETAGLLLIPTYLAVNLLTGKWRQLLVRTLILAVVFLSISLLLRSGVLFRNQADFSDYIRFYTRDYIKYVIDYWGGPSSALERILYTFGPVWVLALSGFWYAPARLRAMSVLPLLAILQILLGTDLYRMVGVSFPVVLALSVVVLDRLAPSWASMLAGLSILYFLSWNHSIGFEAALWGSILLTVLLMVMSRYDHKVKEVFI
jgi:hypothetical protein